MIGVLRLNGRTVESVTDVAFKMVAGYDGYRVVRGHFDYNGEDWVIPVVDRYDEPFIIEWANDLHSFTMHGWATMSDEHRVAWIATGAVTYDGHLLRQEPEPPRM